MLEGISANRLQYLSGPHMRRRGFWVKKLEILYGENNAQNLICIAMMAAVVFEPYDWLRPKLDWTTSHPINQDGGRLFTVPTFSVRSLSSTGRHIGLLMRVKLGRVQNTRG